MTWDGMVPSPRISVARIRWCTRAAAIPRRTEGGTHTHPQHARAGDRRASSAGSGGKWGQIRAHARRRGGRRQHVRDRGTLGRGQRRMRITRDRRRTSEALERTRGTNAAARQPDGGGGGAKRRARKERGARRASSAARTVAWRGDGSVGARERGTLGRASEDAQHDTRKSVAATTRTRKRGQRRQASSS